MANLLSRDRKMTVLHHLLEGNTLRSTTRLTGVHRSTITRHMVEFGHRCRDFMDHELRGLTLDHLEVDEIWTFCGKKQGRLTAEERELCHDIGDIYLWTALDQETKLVPSFVVGKRSANMARMLMRDLSLRLVFPQPHQSDQHAFQDGFYRPIVQISTDMFSAYPEAVDQFFGPYAKYGQIRKDYRNVQQPGRYAPPEMIATERRLVFAMNENERRTICTSHVERHNLTIRTLMKRFTRLSLGFSKKLENLEAACSMFMAYYNWVWRSRYPDNSGQPGRLRPPAAMLAGITDRRWHFEDLFEAVMA